VRELGEECRRFQTNLGARVTLGSHSFWQANKVSAQSLHCRMVTKHRCISELLDVVEVGGGGRFTALKIVVTTAARVLLVTLELRTGCLRLLFLQGVVGRRQRVCAMGTEQDVGIRFWNGRPDGMVA